MVSLYHVRDRWGNPAALWIVAGILFLLPLAVGALAGLRLDNNVENWLSDGSLQTRRYHWYSENFPATDTVLLTWEGSHLDDPRVERLAAELRGTVDREGIRRGGLKSVAAVVTPRQLFAKMSHAGVPREEALRRLQGVLCGPGPLRVTLTPEAMEDPEAVAAMIVRGAQETFGLDCETQPAFALTYRFGPESTEAAPPDGEIEALAADRPEEAPAEGDAPAPARPAVDTTPLEDPRPYDLMISWPHMHGDPEQVARVAAWIKTLRLPQIGGDRRGVPLVEDCFSARGAPVALALTLSAAGAADPRAAIQGIEQAAVKVGIPADRLHLGGSPVAAAALNEEVRSAIWNASAPWYRLHERSLIGLSAVVGIGLAFWMLRSVRLALLVIAIACLTTIFATSLVPLTGGTMNMVLVVMPTLLTVVTVSGAVHFTNYWREAASTEPSTAIVQSFQAAWLPCTLASVTTAAGLVSLLTSELKPVRDFGLFAAAGTLLSLAAVLWGLPALFQIWPGRPPQAGGPQQGPWDVFGRFVARRWAPLLCAGMIFTAVSTAGLSWFRTETKVIRYFADNTRVVQDYRFLEEQLAGIVPVEIVLRFHRSEDSTDLFLDRLEAVRRIQEGLRKLPEVSGTMSLADFQPVVDRTKQSKIGYVTRSRRVEDAIKALPDARELLVVTESDSEFHSAGDELWRITAQVAILNPLDYRELIRSLNWICEEETRYFPGCEHIITGAVPLFQETQQALLESLIQSFGAAFAVIWLMMSLQVRHPVAGLLAMVPNTAPVLVVFGLIAWCGQAVDVGTMITASVGLGMAVDSTLHLLTWFRMGIERGMKRADAVAGALAHCGPAMGQTSVAVAVGLVVLAPSQLLLISRFGWVMAALTAAAVCSNVLISPALLAGPLGWMLERQHWRRLRLAEDEGTGLVPRPHGAMASHPHTVRAP